jgi:dynein heavy chain
VVQHLSRLARIIRKPYGNALMVGIGGNGRKCLSKLAAFIAEC